VDSRGRVVHQRQLARSMRDPDPKGATYVEKHPEGLTPPAGWRRRGVARGRGSDGGWDASDGLASKPLPPRTQGIRQSEGGRGAGAAFATSASCLDDS
jgi:hypothetical protein